VEKQAGTFIFRISTRKRLSYAGVGLLLLAVSIFLYVTDRNASQFGLCAVAVVGMFSIAYYMHKIVLKIDGEGISIFWPLQGKKKMKWDEIAQVRRSDAPPGRNFFIDLIASPDKSVQFNPFMFEHPGDIINELNRHLKFELLGSDAAKEKLLTDELAAVADVKPDSLSNAQWLLIAALIIILIVGIVHILR
jgi:hypothetical protein